MNRSKINLQCYRCLATISFKLWWGGGLQDLCALCLVAPESGGAFSARGVAYRNAIWPVGSTLTVSFSKDVHPLMQAATVGVAREWTRHANIRFDLTFGQGDIRVGTNSPGNFSHVGRYAKSVPAGEPTMNLSVLREHTSLEAARRVILHEFGHALGLGHEHLHSESRIPWDRAKVFAAYRKAGWSDEKIERALFADPAVTDASTYDPQSVMHYPVDNRLTKGDFELRAGQRLSDGDIALISQLYPK